MVLLCSLSNCNFILAVLMRNVPFVWCFPKWNILCLFYGAYLMQKVLKKVKHCSEIILLILLFDFINVPTDYLGYVWTNMIIHKLNRSKWFVFPWQKRKKVRTMSKISQRKMNQNAKKGEADRHIPVKMPKHLFAGKRKAGKDESTMKRLPGATSLENCYHPFPLFTSFMRLYWISLHQCIL